MGIMEVPAAVCVGQESRCTKRTPDAKWRCDLVALSGQSLCEEHFASGNESTGHKRNHRDVALERNGGGLKKNGSKDKVSDGHRGVIIGDRVGRASGLNIPSGGGAKIIHKPPKDSSKNKGKKVNGGGGGDEGGRLDGSEEHLKEVGDGIEIMVEGDVPCADFDDDVQFVCEIVWPKSLHKEKMTAGGFNGKKRMKDAVTGNKSSGDEVIEQRVRLRGSKDQTATNLDQRMGASTSLSHKVTGEKPKEYYNTRLEPATEIEQRIRGGIASCSTSTVRRRDGQGHPQLFKNKKKTVAVERNRIMPSVMARGVGLVHEGREGGFKGSKNKKSPVAEEDEMDVNNGDVCRSSKQVCIKIKNSGEVSNEPNETINRATGKPKKKVREAHVSACIGEEIPDRNKKINKTSISKVSDTAARKVRWRLICCHQCLRSCEDRLPICSNCNRKLYCYECTAKW